TEKPSAVKQSGGLGLFGDEDEDDLFSTAKPKEPPKVQEKKTIIKKDTLDPPKEPSNLNIVKKETIIKPEDGEKPSEPAPVKSKSPSSRIGKIQANLHINPAALLPGAVPKLSGVRHTVPEADISDLPAAESSRSLDVAAKRVEGVSFDSPAQVDTLHNANKVLTYKVVPWSSLSLLLADTDLKKTRRRTFQKQLSCYHTMEFLYLFKLLIVFYICSVNWGYYICFYVQSSHITQSY
ncbi:WASH complex subunit 2-like, partial [Pyxicephalus adspersus]|uniref:WASH complex subunit 2-like n=1 Tax=Pyxicephalus adspersus TaxID=30357 RepID=UPI003B5C9A5A